VTALTYSTYVSTLSTLLVVSSADADFQTILPSIINDAELRIYRDLDLLSTSTRSTTTLAAGNRNLTLPTVNGTVVVCDEINVITPVSTEPDSGTRNQLVPASDEMLNALWPSVTGSTVPQYWAMVNQETVILGPWPDAAYTVEVVHTIRPNQLSSTNTTTLLSVNFPDLLIAASMVFGAGYQKNFGAAVDDPKMAVTWESHYQTLLQSAQVEEARKSFTSQGWSDKQPAPLATPPRT